VSPSVFVRSNENPNSAHLARQKERMFATRSLKCLLTLNNAIALEMSAGKSRKLAIVSITSEPGASTVIVRLFQSDAKKIFNLPILRVNT
jgi:hypothetical protein